jgi:hypothetical protein
VEAPAAVSVETPVQVSVEPPAQLSVEPHAQVSVEPTALVSVQPPAQVSVELHISEEQPAATSAPVPISVSKPTVSKGTKRKGESIDAGPKKCHIISKVYVETSGEESESEIKKKAAKRKSPNFYIDIVIPPSMSQPQVAGKPKPKSKP